MADLDVRPTEFLEFAIRDAQGADRRSLVNALSNAKRAADCRLAEIAAVTGISPGRAPFPERLAALGSVGMASPNLLRKINRFRNELEHEFRCPTSEQVKDAIEVVELFLEATSRVLDHFPSSFVIETGEDAEDRPTEVIVSFQDTTFTVWVHTPRIGETLVVTRSDADYLGLIALCVAIARERDLEMAWTAFIESAVSAHPDLRVDESS